MVQYAFDTFFAVWEVLQVGWLRVLRLALLLLVATAFVTACGRNPTTGDSSKTATVSSGSASSTTVTSSGGTSQNSAFTTGGSGAPQSYVFKRSSVDGRELFFIKQKSDLLPMTAAGRGKLVVDRKGCFRMRTPGEKLGLLLIWPSRFQLETGGGSIRILNGRGQVVAKPGDNLRIGGGEVDAPSSGLTSNEALGRESNVPKECRRGTYWVVGAWESPRPSK